jgi:hypothetical protein
MHLFYVDESYDQNKFVMTALCMEDVAWRANFDATKKFRQDLKATYGIKTSRELHATRFIRDCSDGISDKKLSLVERRTVFEETLKHLATLNLTAFNVCLDVAPWGSTTAAHRIAIERLANRVQATMRYLKGNAMVFFDEGKEKEIRKLVRKMAVFNPIPSAYGTWPDGTLSKNIVLDRVLEDPIFKDSRGSYFLQLADFAAFTLLKAEVPATPHIQRHGYHKLFPVLHPICFKAASKKDPWGIVR